MKLRILSLAAVSLAPLLLDACASYGLPPPPGYAGESWRRHVRRCLRNYPRYDPRSDLIERAEGAFRCPL
jgi:hypothetical protein